MDIEYLLILQNARESLPGFIEAFFLLFSEVADGPILVALTFLVYWCISKRAGQFAMACFSAGNFVSQLMKNLFCVYRPWIRDDRIIPTADAIEGAGGYSFPSGHTNGAGTVLGSFAWLARKKHVVITVICIISFLIIAFSRNYLGVHTPQDVLVGLLIAVIFIALTQMFFNWIDRYDQLMPGHNKDVLVVVIVYALCIASIILVVMKPYPMDYVDDVLLVDPVAMQKGSFEAAGVFMGISLAWLLERRFVGFTTDGLAMRERLVRGVIGIMIVGATYVATDVMFKAIMPYIWAKFFAMFFVAFMAVFVAPLCFGWISDKFGDNPERGKRPTVRSKRTSSRGSQPRNRSSRTRAESDTRAR